MAALDLPPGYVIALGGDPERLAETGGYVVETLVLAVILIFLILASQIESFTQPVAIMLSLPLSLVGGLLTSTMLTLIVVPVAHSYLVDIGGWFRDKVVSPEREREITREQEASGLAPDPIWGD